MDKASCGIDDRVFTHASPKDSDILSISDIIHQLQTESNSVDVKPLHDYERVGNWGSSRSGGHSALMMRVDVEKVSEAASRQSAQTLDLCQDSSITWMMIRMDSVQKFFVSTYYYAVHKYISWALFCPADVQYTYVSTVKLKHFVHQQLKVHNIFSPPRCLNRLGLGWLFLLTANEYFNSATVINSRSKCHNRPLNLMCCIY